ncbi:imidazolonepropionase [Candidatus Falkowbacteria bacterium]|nr:imidazolonepropionase [Candidatus Falkowbacteria bacterium]
MQRERADLLIIHAGELLTLRGGSHPRVGVEMNELGIIENGAAAIKNGTICDVGTTEEILERWSGYVVYATDKVVMPGFVDCHTHAVFAGSRAHEYTAKIKGETYESQHREKKGIFYTVEQTRRAFEEELIDRGLKVLRQILRHGTTTVEIKSGYGLDWPNEFKILNVIKKLQDLAHEQITIIPTFLGAHAVPLEIEDHWDYIDLVVEMLVVVRQKGLAEFCDVFCDQLGFSRRSANYILMAAADLGFKLKAHLDQTSGAAGFTLINDFPLVSADHLDYTKLDEIAEDKRSFVAVLLPGVTYHLMEMKKKEFWENRAQEIISKGFAVALATDYNPGSCPCFSMQAIMELAARIYRMTPEQIINAVTINAAHALCRGHEVGSLEIGKKADIIICDVSDYRELINSFGHNKVSTVIKNGRVVVNN